MNQNIEKLRKKSMRLPLLPGVYMMRDKSGKIIYIGKAKARKNRVSSYFGSQKNHQEKVRRMVAQVQDFDYIITDSEFEALILECSLIKQYTPKYNILLKDDKGYSYIKITKEEWPRISESKQASDKNAEYIGPYNSGYYVKNAVDEARKIFKLPDCTRKFPQEFGKGRPCLNYHIKQCCAPCTGKVSNKEYNEYVAEAVEFLKGGNSLSIRDLTEKMNRAAESMEYERAAKIRDRIAAVRRMQERQKVVATKVRDQDVIALVRNGTTGCFEVFRFKDRKLFDREHFIISDIGDPVQARAEFIVQYYSMREWVPGQITLDGSCEDGETLEQWLSQKAGRRVRMVIPQKGEQMRLVTMCKNNAAERIGQMKGSSGREASALDELASILGLSSVPAYIEAYDISNLAGNENVAGMVVFENGRPLKSAYRKFKIQEIAGQDDYGSMCEVIRRRFEEYNKAQESGEGFGRLPDLILLDGGKGHVSAVQPVLRQMGIQVPLYGMVKDDRHRTRAITGDGGEIAIQSNRRAFSLVSAIQEEVHRFAIGYHRQKRSKNAFKSSLTEIETIGPARAKALLRHFGTIKNIEMADLQELLAAPSMNKASAQAVYNHFHG